MTLNLLVVDDNKPFLDSLALSLKIDGYSVTPIFYDGDLSAVPLDSHYDYAIIDGLNGAWSDVVNQLQKRCKNFVITSSSEDIVAAAKASGYKVHYKKDGPSELEEQLT